MTRRGILRLAVLALLLCGCDMPVPVPVPADKADYVGEWRAPETYLLITKDGSVKYERHRKGASMTIEAPIRAFEGDNFRVGVPFFSTVFVVSKPPYREGDGWKMVVNGVELTKVR